MSESTLLAPGWHDDVPMSRYLEDPGLGGSTASIAVKRSLMHARHRQTHPITTDAMVEGDIVHTLVLEPDELDGRVWSPPTPDSPEWLALCREEGIDDPGAKWKNPTQSKLWRETFLPMIEDRHEGKRKIGLDDLERLRAAASAVLTHPEARAMIERCEAIEPTVIGEADGLRLKARPDGWWPGVDLQLKTIVSAHPASCEREVEKRNYHVSAALRGIVLDHVGRTVQDHAFIFVEKYPPFGVTTHLLDARAVAAGEDDLMDLFPRWQEALETGQFPGYRPHTDSLTLPQWRWRQIEEDNA